MHYLVSPIHTHTPRRKYLFIPSAFYAILKNISICRWTAICITLWYQLTTRTFVKRDAQMWRFLIVTATKNGEFITRKHEGKQLLMISNAHRILTVGNVEVGPKCRAENTEVWCNTAAVEICDVKSIEVLSSIALLEMCSAQITKVHSNFAAVEICRSKIIEVLLNTELVLKSLDYRGLVEYCSCKAFKNVVWYFICWNVQSRECWRSRILQPLKCAVPGIQSSFRTL